MARKAVAASLAAVVLLSVLVVADATVMSAQEDLASVSQASHLESRELLLEQSSAGTAAMEALARVQAFLSADPAHCASLPAYLGSISATGSASGVDSGIRYSANATVSADAAATGAGDNLTVVSPFSGYLAGALDLRAVLSVMEESQGGLVTLARHETHTLNLPISPVSASYLCGSTSASLAAALSGSPCNSTLEDEAFSAALPGLVGEAASRGFTLTAGWGLDGPSCSASYWFTLVEPGVRGVAGSFDWTVLGSGTTAQA